MCTTVGSRRRDPPSHYRLCEATVPSDPSVTINVQYTARYNHDPNNESELPLDTERSAQTPGAYRKKTSLRGNCLETLVTN